MATKQIAETPMDANQIAQAITKISEATQALYRSGLNEKAIILLVSEASGVGRRDVGYVLANLYHLGNTYLAKKKAEGK